MQYPCVFRPACFRMFPAYFPPVVMRLRAMAFRFAYFAFERVFSKAEGRGKITGIPHR